MVDISENSLSKPIPFKSFASRSTKAITSPDISKIKPYNQDCLIHIPAFDTISNLSLFGVLDGHGAEGHLVADYVRRSLHTYVAACHEELLISPRIVVNDIFKHVAHSLINSGIDCNLSGTTTVLCLITENRTIWTANVGDSRAILIQFDSDTDKWVPIELSKDHKPEGSEKQRIIRAGGDVNAQSANGEMRVWLHNQSVPGLSMTRAFGDFIGQKAGIIAEPDIRELTIEPFKEAFLVMGSDGIWDQLSNEEICDMIETLLFKKREYTISDSSKSPSIDVEPQLISKSKVHLKIDDSQLQYVCDEIIKEANKRYLEQEDCTDDTSLIIVHL